MNKYEELEQEAYDNGVSVIPYDFTGTRFKGLYCDGTVAIDKDIESTTEKACVLTEELAHHYATVGNILDLQKTECRKQELQARLLAYDRRIGLSGLIQGYRQHCQSRHELAECLDVSEEFLQEAIDCYRAKYGDFVKLDGYMIFFEPALAVMENL